MKMSVLQLSIINAVVFGLLVFCLDISFAGGVMDVSSIPKAAIAGIIAFLTQLRGIIDEAKEKREDQDNPGKRLGMLI